MVDPADPTRRKSFSAADTFLDLLEPAFRAGERVCTCPPLSEVRARATEQVASLDPTIRRFINPHTYPVGLERGLNETRTRLVYEARGLDPRNGVLHIGGQPFERPDS